MKRIGVADVVISQTSDKRAMKRLGVMRGVDAMSSTGMCSPSTELFSTIVASLVDCSSVIMMSKENKKDQRR